MHNEPAHGRCCRDEEGKPAVTDRVFAADLQDLVSALGAAPIPVAAAREPPEGTAPRRPEPAAVAARS